MIEATGIHSHSTRKLGRRPDDFSKPKLDLTQLVVTGDFSMVPGSQDNLTTIKSRLQMLGNDAAGDCESVRWANHRLQMTGSYPDAATIQQQVWELYRTQNPDFVPGNGPNGYGSNADQGMSSDDLLSYLHKTGGPDGVKVVAYGTIDPRNVQAVERAISVFGGVWVDILVQPENQNEFDRGQPWTDSGEQPEGGHAVLGGAFESQGKGIATWADEAFLSDSFWNGRVGTYALVERVYVVIWPEHVTKEFINSGGAAQLAADYQALTNRPLVWPDVPVPAPVTPPAPAPAPVPAPVGGGASFLVSDPAVVAHLERVASRRGLTPDAWLTKHLERYFDLVSGDVADQVETFTASVGDTSYSAPAGYVETLEYNETGLLAKRTKTFLP